MYDLGKVESGVHVSERAITQKKIRFNYLFFTG